MAGDIGGLKLRFQQQATIFWQNIPPKLEKITFELKFSVLQTLNVVKIQFMWSGSVQKPSDISQSTFVFFVIKESLLNSLMLGILTPGSHIVEEIDNLYHYGL